jgi:cell wall assembly regulator SMI1
MNNKNLVNKLQTILDWTTSCLNNEKLTKLPSSQVDIDDYKKNLAILEALIGNKLPKNYVEIMTYFNSFKYDKTQHSDILSLDIVKLETAISTCEFGKSVQKREFPYIANYEESKKLELAIMDECFVLNSIFELDKIENFYSISYIIKSVGNGYPRVYDKSGNIIEITQFKNNKFFNLYHAKSRKLIELVEELRTFENKSYNWDELNIQVFKNNAYSFNKEIEGIMVTSALSFTSTPIDAIKKQYFCPFWLPFLEDGCGNYIGLDLSPQYKGKSGQIINFGRDEEEMVVLADNLEEFFDLLISEINLKTTKRKYKKYNNTYLLKKTAIKNLKKQKRI